MTPDTPADGALAEAIAELLPCPFCGAKAKAHIWENHTGVKFGGVKCIVCPAEVAWAVHWHDDGSEQLSEAIAAWNRRALIPRPAEPYRCAECDCEGGEMECNWMRGPAEPAPADVAAQLVKLRETFCLASPGSDEGFTAWLEGFDAAVAIISATQEART